MQSLTSITIVLLRARLHSYVTYVLTHPLLI